jgi:hypothetical protein
MLYPERLLPQSNYKQIDFSLVVSRSYYIVRHTKSERITDEEGRLNEADVVLQTDHLRDYSTNLLGQFQPADTGWNWLKGTVCTDLWQSGEPGFIPVLGTDVEWIEERGQFFLAIYMFHNVVLPVDGGEGNITCRVIHTPTRSNFWHCSLRWWLDDNQEDVAQWGDDKAAIKRRRRILSTARTFIITNAILTEPPYQSIPPEAYKL